MSGAMSDRLCSWIGPQTVYRDPDYQNGGMVLLRNLEGRALELFNTAAEADRFIRVEGWKEVEKP